MSAATLYDTGAPTLEVRASTTTPGSWLASSVKARRTPPRWSSAGRTWQTSSWWPMTSQRSTNQTTSWRPRSLFIGSDADYPVASTPVPGCGTE